MQNRELSNELKNTHDETDKSNRYGKVVPLQSFIAREAGEPHKNFLTKEVALLRMVVANAPMVLYSLDSNGIFTFAEGKELKMLGLETKEIVGSSIFDLCRDDQSFLANIRRVLAGEEATWQSNWKGNIYEHHAIPLSHPSGQEMGLMSVAINITQNHQMNEQLRLLAAAVHHAEDGITITSTSLDHPGPEIVFVNPAFTKMTGYTAEEVIGRNPRFLQGPRTDRTVLARLRRTLEEGEVFHGEAINYRKDGTEFYNEWHIEPIRDTSGRITHYLGIQRDITQRKQAEAQLLYSASHDPLTGLPNRAFWMQRLEETIAKASKCQDYLFAVLYLDLDRFKVINDSLGHLVGDMLLVAIANRLKAIIRPTDTVARLGGDEFVILLANVQDLGNISNVADRIQSAVREPLKLEQGQEISTTVSIGIALSTTGYDSPEELLRDADIAMYRAKVLGKARSCVFNKAMHQHAVNRLRLETDLRYALERQELRLHYQPIVSLQTGRITGFEALVRWQHPERGLVSPVDFIPVAEETGLINSIGWWVLREACLKLRLWQIMFPGTTPLTMSVNLSGKQLAQPDLIERVDQILQEARCDRSSLKLELTESAIMEQVDAVSIMEQLRALEVQLGIDDFGTGYSSLDRLYHFPLNTLKIDRAFVSRMEAGGGNIEIIQAIVTLAHSLGMDVVAEGVETAQQLTQLQLRNCEFGQGYFFAKPMDSVAAEALLSAMPQWFCKINQQ